MKAVLVFTLRLVLIIVLLSLPNYSALAGTKTTTGSEVSSSTTIWGDLDAEGNTIYTQLDIYVGYNWGSGVGTQLFLSRTVISPEGEFVVSDDNFYGSFFTTEPVFQTDVKFKEAALAPVTFEGSPRPYTIQVNWNALGALTTRSSSFKQASIYPVDQFQVKFEGDSDSRFASATGSLNGQSFENPSLYAILQRYTTLTVAKGLEGPFLVSRVDYFAPTVELGNKLLRGGEGSIASANWRMQNPDGSTTEIQLSINDGYGPELRLRYFYEGTKIFLSRTVEDEYGSIISYEYGGFFTLDKIFNIANNLDRADLPPVRITICSPENRDADGNCSEGEEVLIQAEWSGVEKLVKDSRFRFTEVTNCDDIDCWSTDFEHNFKVKVVGSGESRNAIAMGSLNGVSLGPSTVDLYGQNTYLYNIKEYTIQYGGIYPFNVFPIQVP